MCGAKFDHSAKVLSFKISDELYVACSKKCKKVTKFSHMIGTSNESQILTAFETIIRKKFATVEPRDSRRGDSQNFRSRRGDQTLRNRKDSLIRSRSKTSRANTFRAHTTELEESKEFKQIA